MSWTPNLIVAAGGPGGTADVYLGSVFFDTNEYPYWFHTLKTTTNVVPPAPHIWINDNLRSGTTYVSHYNGLKVKVGLDASGFAGTPADWWIAANYHGVLYYYATEFGQRQKLRSGRNL